MKSKLKRCLDDRMGTYWRLYEGRTITQDQADKLLLYNHDGERELQGLTKRRKEERELFLLPIEETDQHLCQMIDIM